MTFMTFEDVAAMMAGQSMQETPARRAEVHLTAGLLLGILGLDGFQADQIWIESARFHAGTLKITFAGENCPDCKDGEPVPVVDIDDLR
jgi:hypothetical protein